MEPVLERLEPDECLRLISPGGVGRLAYSGRYGLTVFPVNYQMLDGAVVFRTAEYSPTDEDLRTGMPAAEYDVAFEIDSIDEAAREGWSVLIHGPAHHVDNLTERDRIAQTGVEPWAGGDRQHAIRITPHRISGRRIRHAG
ncbi:MAG: pyridoxamine 5'-phosphate oxidase family protein [Nocardiopsaceae bacterium]|jgi:nitroimidazol reductase NimA-like FMN-containing flavoprotein (pyridoxamine 5'-phosphate oxidase superfamily)|nr:pyridoxamine 5'-phosphate oxidase family protein [Nocardiopsaceae bacterium]